MNTKLKFILRVLLTPLGALAGVVVGSMFLTTLGRQLQDGLMFTPGFDTGLRGAIGIIAWITGAIVGGSLPWWRHKAWAWAVSLGFLFALGIPLLSVDWVSRNFYPGHELAGIEIYLPAAIVCCFGPFTVFFHFVIKYFQKHRQHRI